MCDRKHFKGMRDKNNEKIGVESLILKGFYFFDEIIGKGVISEILNVLALLFLILGVQHVEML